MLEFSGDCGLARMKAESQLVTARSPAMTASA